MKRQDQDTDFSALFEFLPIGAYRSAPDGRQIKANPALVKLSGYETETEMITGIRDIGVEWYVDPLRRQQFKEIMARDGQVSQFVSEIYKRDPQETLWISENAHAIRGQDGEVLYYEGTVENITGRIKTVEELQHNLRVLREIQDLAGVGGVQHDLIKQRVTLTDQVYRMLDLDPKVHHPSPGTVLDYFTPESRAVITEAIQRSDTTGEPYDLELEMVTAAGRKIWVHTKNIVERANGKTVMRTALLQDITGEKMADAIIWRQANFDGLTGLPNRQMLRSRLEQTLQLGKRNGAQVALLFIDLDNFKEVNDSLGHEFGDRLLVEAGRRIQRCVRASDTVARMGGDEFMVILSAPSDIGVLGALAQSVLDALSKPFSLAGQWIYLSASAGISVFPSHGKDMDVLLRHADQALYEAKSAGRNRFSYFTPELQEATDNKAWLANELRDALPMGYLSVVYQPIVELSSGRIFKAEALVRWHHPSRGDISPAVFIPIAERSQLIHDIGDWVLHQAAAQVAHWRTTLDPGFQIAVNRSPAQFRAGKSALKKVTDLLRDLELTGDSLVIEITEGLLMDTRTDVNEQLVETRAHGIQVALDDFGTGYSSMAYLQRFDIDYLKIDQSFVRGLTAESRNHAICKAIIVMAHALGMRVIAEGVETELQHSLLKQAGCDFAQGYWLGRPVKSEHFPGPGGGR
jgi:diguanylate cyclase (GGDEF)-like protein/PAS domain S-box-containing protein